MEQLLEFFKQYGLALTLIAIAGIVVLGVMKYCNLFSKVDEKYRHYIYLGISISLSVICSIIYLSCIGQLTPSYAFAVGFAIYLLNQTAYTTFKTLSINELFKKVLDKVKQLFISLIDNKNKNEDK